MKKSVQILLGCLVSAAMLYFAFRDVKVDELKVALWEVHWWPAIPFTMLFFIHHILRAMRWRLLLPPPSQEPPTIRQLFDATILGNLATFLLPLRVGEFIRPLLLSKWTEYSFSAAFVSVVIERFFDLSAVLLSLAVITPMLPSLPELASVGAKGLGALAGALLLFLIGGAIFPSLIRRLVALGVRPLPLKLRALVERCTGDLLDGAAVIHSPVRVVAIVLLTVGLWAAAFLQFYALLFMFPHELSLLLSVTLGVFVALAVALPSAPGFLGVFQVGCVGAFALFHYPESAAQAYSLIAHAVTYLVMLTVGFALLAIHGLTLGDLKSAAKSAAPEPS